ncbi:MAG: cytochrome c oxidase subunit II [Longimicrobiales bacterium]
MLLIQAARAAAQVEYPQTTFQPVTEYGVLLNWLFMNTFWWTMSILVLVVGLTLAIAIRFRERPGDARPKAIHGHTGLELAWTILPALIVIAITIPTVKVVLQTQQKPPADALTIDVIGHQWWWEFRYPEYGVVTANQLWVPTGRPIHLSMHSADVIHSFWIPRFGGKRDVNPVPRSREGERDKRNHLQFTVKDTGSFMGQCAEFCGDSHALMMVSAMAVTPEYFKQWAAKMKPAMAQAVPVDPNATSVVQASNPINLAMPAPTGIGSPVRAEIPDSVWAAEGKKIFLGAQCIACHTIAGTSAAGVLGPSLTNFGLRPTVGAGVASSSLENVERWIHHPRSMKPGALMPGTMKGIDGGAAPTGLSDAQVHAVARYLKSLK